MKGNSSVRTSVVLAFTGNFGLRCSEALALKVEDVSLQAEVPRLTITGDTLGARKSPGDVYIRKRHMEWLRALFSEGESVSRTRRHKHGKTTYEDSYKPPKTGYLFPSRQNATHGHLHYQAIYIQVKKFAPKFLESLKKEGNKWTAEIARLRPHSGRATLITELMGEGMSTSLSMKYARHAPGSVKVHLKYGRLTLSDVQQACDALEAQRDLKEPRWNSMPLKQLKRWHHEIAVEMKKRQSKS